MRVVSLLRIAISLDRPLPDVEEAVDEGGEGFGGGGDGGVGAAGLGDDEDGGVSAGEGGELVGLLEEALPPLGEAHHPGLIVLDPRHLNLPPLRH